MKFRIVMTATLLGLAAATFAHAADEPQVVRQEMMKKIGGATGAMAKMVKGETPYDQAAAIAALQTIADTITLFPEQFPEGSETGMESEAAPAIWTNKADFEAKAMKLHADAEAAIAANPADVDALKAVFGPLTQNCGSCHETYRLKKG
ncbi:cytochrome c556 [Hoeflea marina]|uniref:Cytochrome c556 n=1 Tax=Hoeflea marina TaxID=274592 RepID=A0A317PPG4_9HYPH|nr:cytochrome c [Hoeflea marina]PWW02171.1 cytochrome c556 [Hoeflea marina]